MSLIVMYNPVCGHGTAKTLFEDEVIPLIRSHDRAIQGIFETTHPGHAGEITLEQLRSTNQDLTVVLGSGDGTLHEIIDSLKGFSDQTKPHESRAIRFALVPCGTANALFSSLFPPSNPHDNEASKLNSLRGLLLSKNTTPLTFALTSLYSTNGEDKPAQTSLSVVVASTALHASILHDSEALRASIPGIDRFKVAAQKNITRWYFAKARLLPKTGFSAVERYDPAEERFIPSEGPVTLDGPFAYFLSTVNVDRLEPAFRVTPLHRSSSTVGASLEVVVIRPLRSPKIADDSDGSKSQFAAISGLVLGGAYRDGAHIRMRYNEDGTITEDGGGASVVEYYRCGGWEWSPEALDEAAHLVCADGDILKIPSGGLASCAIAPAREGGVQFSVFAS